MHVMELCPLVEERGGEGNADGEQKVRRVAQRHRRGQPDKEVAHHAAAHRRRKGKHGDAKDVHAARQSDQRARHGEGERPDDVKETPEIDFSHEHSLSSPLRKAMSSSF